MATVPRDPSLPQIFSRPDQAGTILYPAVKSFLQDAKQAKVKVKAVIADTDEEGVERLDRRRHDLQSAIRTLALAAESLIGGYRFDDERGKSKIAAIAKAVKIVETEGVLALSLLDWAE